MYRFCRRVAKLGGFLAIIGLLCFGGGIFVNAQPGQDGQLGAVVMMLGIYPFCFGLAVWFWARVIGWCVKPSGEPQVVYHEHRY